MAREDLHFRLRIPEDLKAQVEASAVAHKRSMTAEIIARLEGSFAVPDEPFTPEQTDAMRSMVEMIARQLLEQVDEKLVAAGVEPKG